MEDTDVELAAHSNDAYFKEVFSNIERATVFFHEHLPAPMTSRMDWTSLQLVPGSFVKQSLQQAHSDLQFSIRAEGVPCLLYLLFEHQTTVDEMMPLRLLGYILEILRTHAQTHGRPLPPVLPLVLHQGPERWTVSPCFEDLFALPTPLAEALMPYLPKFRHLLLDLSQFDPRRNETDAQLRVVLLLMKMARTKQLTEFFTLMIHEAALPPELLRISLLYALHADTILDVEQIAHTLENNPQLKEEIMSTAAALIAKGKAEGEIRGMIKGKLTFLQEMMHLPVSQDQELSGLEVAELERRFRELQRTYEEQFKR